MSSSVPNMAARERPGPEPAPWWETEAIYQIYPRSFVDANGDGVGDLAGIRSRVEYLAWLGVGAVWLSPIYPSPMVDFGYDIADYQGVDPVFGTLEDFDHLLAALHAVDIRLILDFVPNHSSDQHPWFAESRSSRTSPRRDWYTWSDGRAGGGPPNNWQSYFGGDAWTFDEETAQFYLHSFGPAQPDLNWRNTEVREALFDAMRFWLDRGVDGFRVDVLWLLGKDDRLRDNPPNPHWTPALPFWQRQRRVYSEDWPESHAYAQQIRRVLDEYGDKLFLAEMVLPPERAVAYYGSGDEAHLPHNFLLTEVEHWSAAALAGAIERYERALPDGAWSNWLLGDHDFGRIASRVGRGLERVAQMLLLTLRGTPTLYYGDELGMTDGVIPPEVASDPQSQGTPARDREAARTPMIWTPEGNAGFTGGTPWLPISAAGAVSVETQRSDAGSILHLVRRLLRLRRDLPALRRGGYRSVVPDGPVLRIVREADGDAVEVLLNFSLRTAEVTPALPDQSVLCGTDRARDGVAAGTPVVLAPGEGLVLGRDR